MTDKSYWIKERHNPQTGIYYVPLGQLSAKAAKAHEKSLYGDNYVTRYDSKRAYEAAIEKLKSKGERVLQ